MIIMTKHFRATCMLWLVGLVCASGAVAGPTSTVQVRSSPAVEPQLADPTQSLLQSLESLAATPAEKASVNLHQGDLEEAMSVDGLVASGVVKDKRRAILLRAGMAYSDFGKLAAYKEWITKSEGHKIRPDGVTNPSKELYAVLQGTNGAMWSDPELAPRKAYYEPLLKMMSGAVINPKLSYGDVMKFAGATVSLPNGFVIPKYPMFIGYMHEWQGVVKSYIDANEAIAKGTGPLAGTVRNLEDYRQVFESIYGHNGSGPSNQEYTDWFKKKYGRDPEKTEIPFWTQAHGIVTGNAKEAGVPIFEGSLQQEKYAGSERPNKNSMFHRIMDRVDGAIDPEKIYEEIAFLGPRNALVESYFGGNPKGSVLLQQFTMDNEIDQMVESLVITRAEANVLKIHAENQIRLGRLAATERNKKTSFYAGEELIPSDKIGERVNEITHVEIDTAEGKQRFDFKKVEENGKSVEKLVDASGQGRDFMTLFKKEVSHPAKAAVKRDPNWSVGGDYCGLGGL